jgi:uncharacterized protein (DUF1778 family)
MAEHITKSEMLRFLATPSQARLLKRAAAAQETTLSQFVRATALKTARQLLGQAQRPGSDTPSHPDSSS